MMAEIQARYVLSVLHVARRASRDDAIGLLAALGTEPLLPRLSSGIADRQRATIEAIAPLAAALRDNKGAERHWERALADAQAWVDQARG
jgi:hypothetical protein